jgi:hypothetical protein
MNYKVLSLWEPWATLLVHGIKKIETRPSPTNWTVEKGTYLIHAAKKWDKFQSGLCSSEPFKSELNKLPTCGAKGLEFAFGHIIGSVEIKECCRIFYTEANTIAIERELGGFTDWIRGIELSFGDYRKGRYAWICQNPRVLVNPIPYKGGQGYYQNFNGDESQLIFK